MVNPVDFSRLLREQSAGEIRDNLDGIFVPAGLAQSITLFDEIVVAINSLNIQDPFAYTWTLINALFEMAGVTVGSLLHEYEQVYAEGLQLGIDIRARVPMPIALRSGQDRSMTLWQYCVSRDVTRTVESTSRLIAVINAIGSDNRELLLDYHILFLIKNLHQQNTAKTLVLFFGLNHINRLTMLLQTQGYTVTETFEGEPNAVEGRYLGQIDAGMLRVLMN